MAAGCGGFASCLEYRFRLLKYLGREAVPHEVVDTVGRKVEPEVVDVARYFLRDSFRFRNQLFIFIHDGDRISITRLIFEDKARDVPYFVGKVFVAAHLVFRELHVVAHGGTDDEREARRVGTILFYHRKWVEI